MGVRAIWLEVARVPKAYATIAISLATSRKTVQRVLHVTNAGQPIISQETVIKKSTNLTEGTEATEAAEEAGEGEEAQQQPASAAPAAAERAQRRRQQRVAEGAAAAGDDGEAEGEGEAAPSPAVSSMATTDAV